MSHYLDIHAQFRKAVEAEKEAINDDVVFEIELIKQVEITVDYILLLVDQYRERRHNGKDKDILAEDPSEPSTAAPASATRRTLSRRSWTASRRATPSTRSGPPMSSPAATLPDRIIEEEGLRPAEYLERSWLAPSATAASSRAARLLRGSCHQSRASPPMAGTVRRSGACLPSSSSSSTGSSGSFQPHLRRTYRARSDWLKSDFVDAWDVSALRPRSSRQPARALRLAPHKRRGPPLAPSMPGVALPWGGRFGRSWRWGSRGPPW